jgi:hypothetical protein
MSYADGAGDTGVRLESHAAMQPDYKEEQQKDASVTDLR